jgi:hypothetical protein
MSYRDHWKLPDAVPDDWAARRRLAHALRQISERCVTTDAPTESMVLAAELVEAALARLPPGRTSAAHWASGSYQAAPQPLIDRTALVGQSNPTAPPLTITHDGTSSQCVVTLGERFVGAPVMGHAVMWAERSGLTVALSVTYRRPTPLHVPLHFTATVDEASGRITTVSAQCQLGDEVLSRCTGRFVSMDPEQAQSIFGSRGA